MPAIRIEVIDKFDFAARLYIIYVYRGIIHSCHATYVYACHICLAKMDMKEDISSTGPITAAGTLNDPSGFEVVQNRQEDLTTENVKSYFKPWRVFINHIDSYHGKLLTNVRIAFNKIFRHLSTFLYEII